MKRIFTSLIFATMFWAGAAAQNSHEVVVSAPSTAAGTYAALIASFGPYSCGLTGTVQSVTDANGATLGCGSISTDLSGKIALIDRGTCSFSEKVLNAQNKGAVAVIVVNNAAGALVSMGPTQPAASQVRIPSYFIAQADGAKLKTALAAGLQVRIGPVAFSNPDSLQRDIVWGNQTGQGDFSGGLNGWKVNNISCAGGQKQPKGNLWSWNPHAATPPSSCGRGILNSPTSCNGAMVFASNFLDDPGAECGAALGSGDCPTVQLGELISPVIRLRGKGTPGYQLSFFQSTRQLNSDYSVLWSVNGGVKWDTAIVNEDLTANTSATNPFVLVRLRNTADADSLIVKFVYSGNYYFWIVDDVKISAQEQNNLRVNDFYAIPTNFATPLSQVEPIGFLADVENTGTAAQDNVTLKVSISNASQQNVFSGQRVLGTIAGNALAENQAIATTFTPKAKGLYNGLYDVVATAPDFNRNDNLRAFSFVVTDSTFAKEDGQGLRAISPGAGNWQTNEPHSAAYGNVFFVPKGKGYFSRNVQFALANAAELKGRALILTLYKWADANSDGLAQSTERTAVTFNFYEVKGTESSPLSLISLPLPAETEPPVALEDNTTYLLMMEYYAPQVDGVDFDALVSDQFDYKAQYLLSAALNAPRYTTMTGLAGDLTQETFSPLGYSNFPGDYSYLIRWSISASIATPVRSLPAIEDQFAVFPNPADDLIHVQFALRQTAQWAEATLCDLTGRVVARYSWEQIQQNLFSIPASELPEGMYILNVRSDAGTGSKKVMIAR